MHNYRKNKKLFDTARVVMTYCNLRAENDENFAEKIKDWYRDKEFTALAYKVYNECPRNRQEIIDRTREILDNYDVTCLPMPKNDSDESDCWLGTTCGDYFGYPSENDESIIEQALQEFADDPDVGYLGEIFRRHPEWRKEK